jgi:hypothetical protein
MDKDIERRFLQMVGRHLVSLPHDLKVLYEAKDAPDLERAAREIACGAIVYMLQPRDVSGDLKLVARVDHAAILRAALRVIGERGGEGAVAFRERFAEIYQTLDQDLALYAQALGELYSWLASKIDGLPKLVYRSKRVATYVDDGEAAEFLYEEGLTFQAVYDIVEETLAGRLKLAKPILEHLAKRRAEDARRIS